MKKKIKRGWYCKMEKAKTYEQLSLEDALRLTLVKVVPEEVSRHTIPTKR